MFTKDLNLGFFLFNTINNRSPFKITFCWNFISNAISTNLQPREFIVILKANFRFENCGINCFHFGWGQAYSERPMEVQPEKSKQCQMLPRSWFFILKTSRIDLKKIEEKKSEMKWDTVWSIEVKVKLRTKVIKDISDIECRSRSQPCWSPLIKKSSWNSGKLRDKIATQKCRV